MLVLSRSYLFGIVVGDADHSINADQQLLGPAVVPRYGLLRVTVLYIY